MVERKSTSYHLHTPLQQVMPLHNNIIVAEIGHTPFLAANHFTCPPAFGFLIGTAAGLGFTRSCGRHNRRQDFPSDKGRTVDYEDRDTCDKLFYGPLIGPRESH